MFNIKDKIYCELSDNYIFGSQPYILIDGGKYEDVAFDPMSGMKYRANSYAELLAEYFNDDEAEFLEYISSLEKIKIIVCDKATYTAFYEKTINEVFGFFYVDDQQLVNNITDTFVLNEYSSTGTLYNFDNSDDTLIAGFPNLNTDIIDIPLEYVVFFYANNIVSEQSANEKIAAISDKFMLETIYCNIHLLIEQIQADKQSFNEFLGLDAGSSYYDSLISSTNNPGLTKLLTRTVYPDDLHSTELFKQITDTLKHFVALRESLDGSTEHIDEINHAISVFNEPDINTFVADVVTLLDNGFFSKKIKHFNISLLQRLI